MKVDYTLAFTAPIFYVLIKIDIDMATFHLVYEIWDSMIENMKNVIYHHERKTKVDHSSFDEIVHSINLSLD